MITCMCIIYTGLVVLLFKFKILRPRPYPIAWCAVGGVLVIGAIVVFWRLDAPMSGRVVTTQYVVQLVPYVKGQIKKVVAKANQPIKKGDVLVEIDASTYQDSVNQLQAQFRAAQEGVKQAEAGVESAKATVVKTNAGITQYVAAVSQAKAAVTNAQAGLTKAKAGVADAQATVTKAKAADDLAKTEEQIALNLQRTDAGAISTLRVTQAQQKRAEADAAVTQANTGVGQANAAEQQAEAGIRQAVASEQQAEAGLAEAKAAEQQAEAAERQAVFAAKVAESNVPAVKAQLDGALFNLAQCTMYAPADGYIVDWQVQEGSWATDVRVTAIGTFIVTQEMFVVAVFPQNYLMNVQAGDDVELILDPYPGRIFKSKVDAVITATGEGQFAPNRTMPDAGQIHSGGLLAVKINLTDRPADVPLGAGGHVAIYTQRGKPVHVISKVVLRIKKWLLYVVPA